MTAGTLAGRPRPAPRRAPRPVALLTASCLVAAVLALPLVFLLIEAHGAGLAEVVHLIFRPLTGTLLWNTVRLTVVVTAAVRGDRDRRRVVRRADRPARPPGLGRARGGAARDPRLRGELRLELAVDLGARLPGAVIVMTLAVYPLVYLPVAASLRSADPGQEEVARSLGLGPGQDLRPDHPRPGQGRHRRWLPAGRAGPAGRVRRVRDRRLPDLHHRDLHRVQRRTAWPRPVPCPWCWCCSACSSWPGRACSAAAGTSAVRPAAPSPPQRLGRARWPVLALFAALVLLALGVPVGSTLYWMADGLPPALSGGANVSLLNAAGHTALFGGGAGALATVMAVPVALLAIRHRGRMRHVLERAPTWSWACPAWSSRSPCPTSSSVTPPGSATGRRCCSSPATRSCSSRWPWSGSSVAGPGAGQPRRGGQVAGPAQAGRAALRARRRWHDQHRRWPGRRARGLRPAGTAPHRLRPAGRQPVPPSDRGGQRRFRPVRPGTPGRSGREQAGTGRPGRPGRAGRAVPASAVRRPATTGRAGPDPGHRAGRGTARRAVRLAGRPPAGQRPR